MNTQRWIILLMLSLFPSYAFAYLDPGSGSAIVSAIIGFVVALAMGVKTYWYKIKSFFMGSKKQESLDSKSEESSEKKNQTLVENKAEK